MKKKLKTKADMILKLERECALGNNVQNNLLKIEEISSTLSLEDLLAIDEYIQEKLLTE